MAMSDTPIIPDVLCVRVPSDVELRALPEAEKFDWVGGDPLKTAAFRIRMEREYDRRYGVKVRALIVAGWTFELFCPTAIVAAWAWRRPPRRRNSKGMRFASTNQVYNALMRERARWPNSSGG